jgi:hypothetical protein
MKRLGGPARDAARLFVSFLITDNSLWRTVLRDEMHLMLHCGFFCCHKGESMLVLV